MPEQTNVTWWNPFNLVDNPQNSVQPAPTAQPTQQAAVQAQTTENTSKQEEKWPSGLTKKIIQFIAKLAGQPDPETWAANTTAKTAQPADQGNQAIQNNTANFDNIMSWVTWFLDKIWNKIEDVTWINLDAPIQGNQTQNQTPTQAEQPQQTPAQPQTPAQQ